MDKETIKEWAGEIIASGKYYSDSDKDYTDKDGQTRCFECFVNDGIVCEEKWEAEGNPHILVILREAREQFDPKCKRDDIIGYNIYDLTQYLTKSNDKYTFEWNMPHSTYRPPAKWIREIFAKFEYLVPENDNIFEHVAVINLKKTPGGAHCDKKKLNEFCEDFKKYLCNQILEIKPHIVILANEYNNFFKKIMKDYIAQNEIKHVQSKRKEPSPLGLYICKQSYLKATPLLVFNAYHPCTNRTNAEDFQTLLDQDDLKK